MLAMAVGKIDHRHDIVERIGLGRDLDNIRPCA